MRNEKIAAVADCLDALAESLRALMQEDEKPEVKIAEEKKPGVKPEDGKKADLKLEDVRKILAAKSAAGFTAQVRELLKRHGAEKLSAVSPADYQAILEEAEGLGNE